MKWFGRTWLDWDPFSQVLESTEPGAGNGWDSLDWPSAMPFALAMREKNEGSARFPVCLLPEPILNYIMVMVQSVCLTFPDAIGLLWGKWETTQIPCVTPCDPHCFSSA